MTDKKKEKKTHEEKKPQAVKIEDLQNAAAKSSPKEAAETKEKLLAAEDKYLRLCAEFDNYRKRTENEKSEFAKYAAGNFIEAVLPVLDSFERSQKALETDANAGDEVKKGFALIHKQLEDVLQKFGVKKMEAVGKIFDPRFQEAVMQKESDQPAQTVLEELQTGYVMYDKVLRAAMVVVAK